MVNNKLLFYTKYPFKNKTPLNIRLDCQVYYTIVQTKIYNFTMSQKS
jgi:hypothetical protein